MEARIYFPILDAKNKLPKFRGTPFNTQSRVNVARHFDFKFPPLYRPNYTNRSEKSKKPCEDGALLEEAKPSTILERQVQENLVHNLVKASKSGVLSQEFRAAKKALSNACSIDKQKRRKKDIFD